MTNADNEVLITRKSISKVITLSNGYDEIKIDTSNILCSDDTIAEIFALTEKLLIDNGNYKSLDIYLLKRIAKLEKILENKND